MRTPVITPEIIDVPLTPEAKAVALWAREAARRTFEDSVAGGHLKSMPALPMILNDRLRISTDPVVWEEFDYQLTVGLRELEFPEDAGVEPVAGEDLNMLLRTAKLLNEYQHSAVA